MSAEKRTVESVVLRFLARVMIADGTIDRREVELLVQVAGTMHIDEDLARRIVDEEATTPSDPEALAREIAEPMHLRSVYALGCLMAFAEEQIAPSEAAVLAAFARGAGIGDDEAAEILADAQKKKE